MPSRFFLHEAGRGIRCGSNRDFAGFGKCNGAGVDALRADAGFGERWLSHWNALPLPLVWAKRKLFRARFDTSDVKLSLPTVEAVLKGVMAFEHAWIRSGGKWAWGVSILTVGRKRA
jgi:hypothetical protein